MIRIHLFIIKDYVIIMAARIINISYQFHNNYNHTFKSLVLTSRDSPLIYPTNNILPLLWQLKHVTGEF